MMHIKLLVIFDNVDKQNCLVLDCVHAMPAHFENGEKCDGQASGLHENGTCLAGRF